MIKHTVTALMLTATLTISSLSFAANFEQNMQLLGKNYKAFNQATNSTEALKALENMRIAALEAKQAKLMPQSGQSAQPTSTALFDKLVTGIDQTKLLVQAGKLDEAKIEGKKLGQIRDLGHKIYR